MEFNEKSIVKVDEILMQEVFSKFSAIFVWIYIYNLIEWQGLHVDDDDKFRSNDCQPIKLFIFDYI